MELNFSKNPMTQPMTQPKPLAEKSRPQSPENFLGQRHLWSPNATLRRLVETDQFFGLLFWGPPGTGKTSLARLIATMTEREVVFLSAVEHGVKDIRQVVKNSQNSIDSGMPSLLLFMDEVHRLSKNQQDALLPAVEDGSIKFIGATTENPSFEVNKALLSRVLVFPFRQLSQEDIKDIITQACRKDGIEIKEELLEKIAAANLGDARKALTIYEAVKDAGSDEDIDQFLDSLGVGYAKMGEDHYDIVSAFIKSIRASEPQAATYYLARMIAGGEDPNFIARRLVIAAAEDIGNANPMALLMATSAQSAVHMLGYPEARIVLAQATHYLACSPKSNASYLAIDSALDTVRKSKEAPIPMFLRNAPTELMQKMGYAKGYIYPHDHPEEAWRQTYLPEPLAGRVFYEPKDSGTEKQFSKYLEFIKNQQ